jgi:HlyD family secretion protein/adhesin transport system membrane fusion protein
VVKPGDRIAEITPIDDKLIIEAKIKSSDRGQIVEGQKASIAITAYSYTKFGMLDGELLSISPDSFIDKNGGSFYHVKIKADKQDIAKDKPIMPGMVANVNIITGKKTIMRYILKPLKDITTNSLHEQ